MRSSVERDERSDQRRGRAAFRTRQAMDFGEQLIVGEVGEW